MNPFKHILFLTAFLVLGCVALLNSQSSLKVTSGIGSPELIHVGLQLEGANNHIGFSIGTIPGVSESLWSVCGDYFQHFKQREDGSKNPWYFRTGAAYLRERTRTSINTIVLINVKTGRMFSFSKKVGLYLDLGIAINAYENKKRLIPRSSGSWNFDIDVSVIPIGSLVLFFRL